MKVLTHFLLGTRAGRWIFIHLFTVKMRSWILFRAIDSELRSTGLLEEEMYILYDIENVFFKESEKA